MANHGLLPAKKEKRPRFRYGYIVILVSFFITVIGAGSQYSFGVFFKPVLNEFGWTRAVTSGAYSLNMIFAGIVGIIAGRLSDRFSPRVVITVCGFIMSLGYLLMSQVQSVWQIYLFYGIFVSFGIGGTAVPLLSTAARWFARGRSLATGIIMTGMSIGIAVIPPLANMLITKYSWQTSYIIMGSVTFVAYFILAWFIRHPPDHASIPIPNDQSGTTAAPNSQVQGLSTEEAIRTRRFWMINLISLFFFFGLQTVMVHIVAHATDIGIAAATAATILSVIGMVSIAGNLMIGWLGA